MTTGSRPIAPADALADGARALGVPLPTDQLAQFDRYATALLDWNRRVNLTTITDPLNIVRKHFLDSLALLTACDLRPGDRLIDVGSGGGFPGVPLRIARPDLRLTLLEATRKKCDALRDIVARLDLRDVTILPARAEEAGRDPAHREQYRGAVARAVAELATLAEYVLPFVEVGGWVAAQKSGDVADEVARAQAAIETLGGRVQRVAPINVPGLDETRAVVLVEKVAPTPERYPRRAGIPRKKPIR